MTRIKTAVDILHYKYCIL